MTDVLYFTTAVLIVLVTLLLLSVVITRSDAIVEGASDWHKRMAKAVRYKPRHSASRHRYVKTRPTLFRFAFQGHWNLR
jgi:hypothetical protein